MPPVSLACLPSAYPTPPPHPSCPNLPYDIPNPSPVFLCHATLPLPTFPMPATCFLPTWDLATLLYPTPNENWTDPIPCLVVGPSPSASQVFHLFPDSHPSSPRRPCRITWMPALPKLPYAAPTSLPTLPTYQPPACSHALEFIFSVRWGSLWTTEKDLNEINGGGRRLCLSVWKAWRRGKLPLYLLIFCVAMALGILH